MAVSGVRSGFRGRIRRAVAVGACVAAVGLVPSTALATPGSGVTGTILAKGTSDDGLKIKTRGRTDVVVRTITVAPGGSTGWHYHQGELIAVVQSGTLTRTMHDCTVETTTAGKSFVEPAGPHHVHIGRNLGTEPVVLYVTYLLPEGAPLSVDAPDPGCGV
ncbi:cupin domain-containing protein [Streptomyces sp. NBC_00286]|uniref:cupin domain-containing protein n=1 Tax=Streptomyces sp. NBC_00286 TaxID=2975701 RepID=UPI002E2A9DF9|nr:cupin domain-containing protein [Streptomyces sp. NBC_00286]